MPITQVILFLIKYGLGVLQLVKGVWELVDWIKARDPKVTVNAKMMRQNLHVLAKKARATKSTSELKRMHASLSERKLEIQRGEL